MKKILGFMMLLPACGPAKTATLQPSEKSPLVEGCGEVDAGKTEVVVDADIKRDTTWTEDNVYRLGGKIFVENGTLTVAAGTRVEGTVAQLSALIVTASARLDIKGSRAKPVVFTSCRAVGSREAGDWGGIALLGKAQVNTAGGVSVLEGVTDEPRVAFGGTDNTHNCGSLEYFRAEFAGKLFVADKELNSLTLAGCGSQTKVDYFQSHRGKDDAIEFFGGTVNVKHLVLTDADDDGFDWQLGYAGKAQFVLFRQGKTAGADQGIEADNNDNLLTATPYSNPIVANATFIGAGKTNTFNSLTLNGALLRRGTKGEIVNTVFTEFKNAPLVVQEFSDKEKTKADPATANFVAGELKIHNILTFNNGAELAANVLASLTRDTRNLLNTDPKLTGALAPDRPNALPQEGSVLLDATKAATLTDPFFDPAPYVGAFGQADWTLGWTAYPNN